MRFDVDLHSIPNVYLNGYEVVTMVNASEVKNKGLFYTDSNGLEMQERILNYRSYYNLTEGMYQFNPQNITANWYPVNSAIAIKDLESGMQLTVLNDRS